MTATVTENNAEARAGGVGRVVRVIGPTVDVEFPAGDLPQISNALTVRVEGEQPRTLTLEVAQHLGDNVLKAIALQPTDGLVRGSEVTDTGGPIAVPVGNVTKGHVWNVVGECLNLKDGEQLEINERWGIHR